MLEIENLQVRFPIKKGGVLGTSLWLKAVDQISLKVLKGQTMAIVGESGSGKTTLALAIARLVPIYAGKVLVNGIDLYGLTRNELRTQRRRLQFIFQDPYCSLNPRLRAGKIVQEPLDRLKIGSSQSRKERVIQLFDQVGLRQDQLRLFPHQFSGGQRQRNGIARAIASNPELVICDEPVSALDVGVQAQILNLLRRLQIEMQLTYLFISHDLGVVQHVCDEVAVMYMGKVVEQTDRISFFNSPLHPYSQALLSAVPSAVPGGGAKKRVILKGETKNPLDDSPGCSFASRCPKVEKHCWSSTPELKPFKHGHLVACHLV
ncbi:MAG: ABC transporter ATP-binding protein [SAR324 cluster bacterium]|nr:ABC transporter ATP-binding protein [SAR324 cluster bacterium]